MTSSFTPPALLQTAVLFLVFNRPDTTTQVFGAIRQAKPPRLYVAADGPRDEIEGEAERVAKVRKIAVAVDWPCEVKTLFREKNLGCKHAVSEAINWFFDHEERGIILEDDCLPAPSFFPFCETLLARYKDDERIWHIGGTNPLQSAKAVSNGYYYSVYNRIWGWATWRRAWSAYDVAISDWPEAKRTGLLHHLLPTAAAEYYTQVLSRVHEGKIDTWDYQWFFTRLTRGLAVIPDVNLISNIGFGEGATHTNDTHNVLSQLPIGRMTFPLREPPFVTADAERDVEWSRMAFRRRKLGSRVRALSARIIKGMT